ncbi:putative nuclease HARBI1 [Pieris napi]|uniref:putative nuclease HARBI1 n=1 Tax=Pieris napi TaxID=78633 RepID=UPI001FBAEA35|nr:putative nuclease HARBI1 [Pieris napi]
MQRLRRIIYESDSDDDSENENYAVRRPRWIKERNDHFNNYDDEDFRIRFRLSKVATYNLLVKIENRLEFISERNQSVSPVNQLLATLRFYATNNTQLTIGDFSGLSVPTAHRIIHRVSAAIASLHHEYIKFPNTQQEIRQNQQEFYRLARFPRVIGAMDCTHIRISSPGGEQAELFRNRKGYFSINVQTICNANLEIIDIVARWPGSAHDSLIFNNCCRKAKFEAGEYGEGILLVDGGYAATFYSMPPLETT